LHKFDEKICQLTKPRTRQISRFSWKTERFEMENGSCAITDDKNRKYNFLNWEGRRKNVEEVEKNTDKNETGEEILDVKVEID
jgi:hypothetical protein